jgi:hypothetical protein
MGFSQENGYVPQTIEALMDLVMEGVNDEFGTTYTTETFIGTGWYKVYYAAMQRLQENEVKTSEIFLKLQDYFIETNERISRPVNTNPGLVDKLEAEGYTASVKQILEADAGKIYVCVDVDETDDDYLDTRLDICTIIKDSTSAGCVTQGSEVETITLSNGQDFAFKYNLPNRIPVLLKLTITTSDNNQVVIGSPDDTKLLLMQNIAARYRLGRDFEPQRYFSVVDAPWASTVLLEWSDDDGGDWDDTVFEADYDDLYTFDLGDIELVEV